MKPYPSYKDSGVEWIGKIPSDWKVTKHKYNLEILSGFPFNSKLFSNKKGFPLIRIRDITSGSLNTFYEGDYSDKYIVKKGDLLIGMDGDFNVRWWEGDLGLLNQRCCSIKESSTLNRKWLFYLLPNELKIINDLTYFTTVKHLSNNDIYDSKTILPIKETQTQIVSFLDNKTQKIDQLIDLTEKKIKLLKEQRTSLINHCITKGLNPNVEMKDSGIEWIGKIPSHWYRTKISRFCEVKDGTHDTPKFLDPNERTIPLVTSNSFINGEIDFTKSKHISIEDYTEINKRSDVQINDIIMSMIGSNIGNRVLVKTDSPFSIKNVCLFKTSKSVGLVPKYLLHLIDSKYLLYQVDFNQKGGGQPFLSLNELRNLIFPFPPENEQNQIVEHLDKLTQKVDTTIEIESQRIDLLKEYRQSLISEVVTGKIDVRDWKE